MRRILSAVIGILVSVAYASSAQAATVLALTLEELAERSDRVVRARVVSQTNELDSENDLVFRITTLEILEDLRGEGPARVEVRQLGGEASGRGLWIEGDARFEPGEEVVVFLSAHEANVTRVHLVGLSLGKFGVRRLGEEATVVRHVEGLTLVRPDGERKPIERRLSLGELRDRVRRVAPTMPENPRGEER